MKIEWVNQGKEFEPTKITIGTELDILEYLEQNTKEMSDARKNYIEFIETVYRALNKIDKNVTRELIKEKTTATELGILFVAIRTQGNVKYNCPHCKKSFTYTEMNKAEGDKNFQQNHPDIGHSVTGKEN